MPEPSEGIRLNQHVNYLFFGWLGILTGFVSGVLITQRDIRGLFLFSGAFLGGLMWTACAQDFWLDRVRKAGWKLRRY